MKKKLAFLMALAMTLALTACSSSDDTAADTGDDSATMFEVGVVQLIEHAALDAATQGFIDALEAAMPGQVNVTVQTAQGDSNTCSTIVNGYVSSGVDLILANATAALQASVAGSTTIPILGTSVTEYGVALDIDDFDGIVGGNVSGTSDLAPLDEQAAMVQEWFPDAETVGLLYCSAEANSKYQVDVVKAALEGMGYTCTLYPFTDSNDLASITTTAAFESDVIYVPTDNTVASNTGIIDSICQPAGVPIIAGEENTAAGCGVATLSIDYYDLGLATGEMAAQILSGEADISTMPISYAADFTPKYNADMCDALGLTPPEGYVAIEIAE